MPDRLNDLTAAEIAEYKERSAGKRTDRACAWCDKIIKMRADQHFCCASCRAAYASAAARLQYENLVREKEVWAKERESLIREISELRSLLSSQ